MPEALRETAVTIEAPGRLHMGFLDLDATIGRRYGSLGLAIDQPSTRLRLAPITDRKTGDNLVTGVEHKRASAALSRFQAAFGLSETPLALHVETAIPAHAGLGSGTQLAIAVGMAVARLTGHDASARHIGEQLDRGARSAIGMAAFETGGFLVDGGRRDNGPSAPIVARLPFPETWRIILVLDRSSDGVHGDKETAAFANLPPMPQATAAHLSHLTLMRLLPALAEADLRNFGDAVGEIQATVGRQFAPYQGGNIWASDRVGAFVRSLADGGAAGPGQSSWGPTGFVFSPSETDAAALTARFADAAAQDQLDLLIVRGRNTGARIDEISLAQSR